MNKKIFITGIILTSINLIYSSCVSEGLQTTRDLQRLLPPVPSSFSYDDSVRLIRNWTLGMHLYKNNCSSCHGIFGKSKDTIPNFSKVQFDDYKSAYLAGDSANHAVMAKMTQEELNSVFLFLTDLKRN